MVALVKSLSASLQAQIALSLIAVVTLSIFANPCMWRLVIADGNLVAVFDNKAPVFVAFVASLQVCLAFVAACCLHCFHCRFALALGTVV